MNGLWNCLKKSITKLNFETKYHFMKLFYNFIVLLLVGLTVSAQKTIETAQFFDEEAQLVVNFTSDFGTLMNGRNNGQFQPATFSFILPDGSTVSEEIKVNTRGHSRKTICNIPPIRLSFKNTTSPILTPLGNLKLVNECKYGNEYEQLLLKEFLVYKILNVLTDKSFKVRLLKVTYTDSKGKKKPFTKNAFVLENIDAMSKRLKSKELNNIKVSSEAVNRTQMTLVNIFEYMIGNTDWSVPNNHNIKLLKLKKDSAALPFTVPYDFDYSGFVNADYAVPDEMMGIESVVQRVYRGFPRNMEELQVAIDVFKKHKEEIYKLYKSFDLLDNYSKKEIGNYLDDFYKIINNPKEVQKVFIDNARTK